MGPSTHVPWRFGLIPTESDWFGSSAWNAWGANLRNSKFKQREPKGQNLLTETNIDTYLSLNSLTTSDRAQMRSMCKACAKQRTESLRQVTTSLVGDVGDVTLCICNTSCTSFTSCFPLPVLSCLPARRSRRSRSSDRKWSSGLGISETFRARAARVGHVAGVAVSCVSLPRPRRCSARFSRVRKSTSTSS